jgi:hypothetical protein
LIYGGGGGGGGGGVRDDCDEESKINTKSQSVLKIKSKKKETNYLRTCCFHWFGRWRNKELQTYNY